MGWRNEHRISNTEQGMMKDGLNGLAPDSIFAGLATFFKLARLELERSFEIQCSVFLVRCSKIQTLNIEHRTPNYEGRSRRLDSRFNSCRPFYVI